MASVSSTSRSLRVPKRKASAYADTLFNAQKDELARKLVSLRLGQGLSQEALAYEAEVERSYVSLIERGQGNPSLRVLCQLAQRLGVSVIEILGGSAPTYPLPVRASAVYVIQEQDPKQPQGQVPTSSHPSTGNT